MGAALHNMFSSLSLLTIGTLIGTIRGNHPETIGCSDFDVECALLQEVSDAGQVRYTLVPDYMVFGYKYMAFLITFR